MAGHEGKDSKGLRYTSPSLQGIKKGRSSFYEQRPSWRLFKDLNLGPTD